MFHSRVTGKFIIFIVPEFRISLEFDNFCMSTSAHNQLGHAAKKDTDFFLTVADLVALLIKPFIFKFQLYSCSAS